MAVFELILCIIAAVVLSSFLSRFIPKVSTPLVQIALGALATQMPFFPDVTLDPELFMVLFIAPLLYLEAHEIDKRELRSVSSSTPYGLRSLSPRPLHLVPHWDLPMRWRYRLLARRPH